MVKGFPIAVESLFITVSGDLVSKILDWIHLYQGYSTLQRVDAQTVTTDCLENPTSSFFCAVMCLAYQVI